MLVLVLDSSTPAVTTALVAVTADGVDPRAARRTVDARAHGELLAPQVAAGAGRGGRARRRPDRDRRRARPRPLHRSAGRAGHRREHGPGARHPHVRGLLAGRDRRPGAPTGAPVLAATDARRREIYWAVYDGTGARTVGPGVDTPAVVAERARELGVTRGGRRRRAPLRRPARPAGTPRAPLPGPAGARRARRRPGPRRRARRAAHPALPAPPRRGRGAGARKSVLQ